MHSRTPTKAEQRWLAASYQVPCLACALYHDSLDSPAEYHHITGRTAADAHFHGFSLCARHHRIKDNNKPQRWISRHGDGRAKFEKAYQSEGMFYEQQKQMVARLDRRSITTR